MPIYSYYNPDNESEIVDVVQSMNDEHTFFKDGKKWNRKFYAPMASIDSDIDPNNREEFARRAAKYSTIGDLADKSRELSEKRKAKEGFDPVEKKFFKDYSASRKGARHPLDKAQKIETKFATVDFTAKG